MNEALQSEERALLTRLTELESEAGGYRSKLESTEIEINSVKTSLNGVRHDILDEFLTEKLAVRFIAYVIKANPSGEITLSLSPMAGGELEFDRLKSSITWADMSNVPLFHVLAYLSEGTPWTTNDLRAYAV